MLYETEEVEHAREREHFHLSRLHYFKLFDNEIVTPWKNGMSGHPVPNPSGAEAIVSDR